MNKATPATTIPKARRQDTPITTVRARRLRRAYVPHIVLILLVLVSIYPLIFTLFASLKSNAQFYTSFWIPTPPFHWDNYSQAWKVLSGGFANSVVISAITVIGVVFMSALSAWTFARYEFPAKEIVYYL